MPQKAFQRFLSLPKELRNRIWEYSLHDMERAHWCKLSDLKLYGFTQPYRLHLQRALEVSPMSPRIPIPKLHAVIYTTKSSSYQPRHLFHIMQVCHSARQAALLYWRRRVGQAKITAKKKRQRLEEESLKNALLDALVEPLEPAGA